MDEGIALRHDGSHSTYALSNRLRWAVPNHTTTKSPVLQQCWIVTEYEDGKAVRQRDEWRDVERVVIED